MSLNSPQYQYKPPTRGTHKAEEDARAPATRLPPPLPTRGCPPSPSDAADAPTRGAMAAASRARLPLKLVSQGSLSGEKVVFEQVTHLVEVAKEVPYEGLKIKRASTHKDLMKHMMLRQSGLIGTNAGKIGYLTYGSYCEKDVARMNSIGVGKASAVGTGLQKMKPAPAQTVGKQLSRPKSNATVISDECSYPEIPNLVLIRKSRAGNGYKSLMAQSIIRRGGLYGEKVCDGLGTIAYGSIGLGDKLEF